MAMTPEAYRELLGDLRAEGNDLMSAVADVPDQQWRSDTPSPGWTIQDQVAHLAFFDEMVALALTDATGFRLEADAVMAVGDDWIDRISLSRRRLPPSEVLAWFRTTRAAVLQTLAGVDASSRGPWFGPPMSAASSATARLMETWAHGQDIYDAIGRPHPVGPRLRHVCHLGVLTRGFSYQLHGRTPPEVQIRVELSAPDDDLWTWGPDTAVDRITGAAGDFALVVTQRRAVGDTGLRATPGPAADWLAITQAYAGAPGPGRPSATASA